MRICVRRARRVRFRAFCNALRGARSLIEPDLRVGGTGHLHHFPLIEKLPQPLCRFRILTGREVAVCVERELDRRMPQDALDNSDVDIASHEPCLKLFVGRRSVGC